VYINNKIHPSKNSAIIQLSQALILFNEMLTQFAASIK